MDVDFLALLMVFPLCRKLIQGDIISIPKCFFF